MNAVQREPSADMRVMARALRDMFDALILEDFATHEALAIIGYAIAAQKPPA